MKKFALFTLAGLLLLAAGCSDGSFGKVLNLSNDDEYSILLYTAQGPRHAQMAEYYKTNTAQNTDWSDLYIVHNANTSDLYRGKYPHPQAAQDDLKQARTFKFNGRKIFPFAIVVPVAGNPIGKPEYELSNAKGKWTVLVGLFIDDPKNQVVGRKRMKAAVEYCNWLRQKGYEAYYYHMSARSQVTVGTFPEEAIVMKLQKKVYRQQIASQPMIKLMNTEDPPLKYLAVNGRQEIVTRYSPDGKKQKIISRSRPIPIPQKPSLK